MSLTLFGYTYQLYILSHFGKKSKSNILHNFYRYIYNFYDFLTKILHIAKKGAKISLPVLFASLPTGGQCSRREAYIQFNRDSAIAP